MPRMRVERYSGSVGGLHPRPILQLELRDVIITGFQIHSLPLGGFEQLMDFSFSQIEVNTQP